VDKYFSADMQELYLSTAIRRGSNAHTMHLDNQISWFHFMPCFSLT